MNGKLASLDSCGLRLEDVPRTIAARLHEIQSVGLSRRVVLHFKEGRIMAAELVEKVDCRRTVIE